MTSEPITKPGALGPVTAGSGGQPQPLGSLVVEGSRFARLRSGAGTPLSPLPAMVRSLAEVGQLAPILVTGDGDQPELVDGFARVAAARELGWEQLLGAAIPATPATATLDLLIAVRRAELAASAVARARLVALATSMAIAEARVIDQLLPAIGLQGHPRVLRSCLAVAGLPEPVLDFCGDKGFSLRQCEKLASFPRPLVELVFGWRDRVSLTASLLVELLDDLGDFAAANQLTWAELAGREELLAIVGSDEPPQLKGRQLRDLARRLRSPILTRSNARIAELRDRLRLGGEVTIDWDRSLERRELRLAITLRDPGRWPELATAFGRPELAEILAAMLAEL